MVFIPKNAGKLLSAKKSKYGNNRVEAQGKKFDSVGERDRFFFLQDAQRRGSIRNVRCQVSYDLKVNDKLICRYVADFVYDINPINTLEIRTVVEDFKGGYKKLPVFALKEKLMLACHDIKIHIVKSPTAPIS